MDPSVSTLTLPIGAAAIRDIYLLSELDETEDVSGVTDAKLHVKENISDILPLISKSISDSGGLVLTVLTGKLTATFDGTESADLEPGKYIADIAVLIAGKWYSSEYFDVELTERVTVPT